MATGERRSFEEGGPGVAPHLVNRDRALVGLPPIEVAVGGESADTTTAQGVGNAVIPDPDFGSVDR